MKAGLQRHVTCRGCGNPSAELHAYGNRLEIDEFVWCEVCDELDDERERAEADGLYDAWLSS